MSPELEKLRAIKAREATKQPQTQDDAAVLVVDANVLEGALAVAQEAADAADKERAKQQVLVSSIETKIVDNKSALAADTAAVEAAALAGKSLSSVRADLSAPLNSALKQARAKLEALVNAAAQAEGAVAKAKDAIARRAEAERRAALRDALAPLLDQIRAKVAEFAITLGAGTHKIDELEIIRVTAKAAKNVREFPSAREYPQPPPKLRFEAGNPGGAAVSITLQVALEPEPEAPGVLNASEIRQHELAEVRARAEANAAERYERDAKALAAEQKRAANAKHEMEKAVSL